MAHHSMVNTTFPVHLPDMPELRLPKLEFQDYINSLAFTRSNTTTELPLRARAVNVDAGKPTGDTAGDTGEKTEQPNNGEQTTAAPETSRFMDGLLADRKTAPTLDERDGKMLTENDDVAHRTSGEPLVDAFFELEPVISCSRLRHVLDKAWEHDADATLKIIWNARSIHLGKSSRTAFYRAVGWLAEKHPVTLLTNLPWLARPLIPKKAPKPDSKKDETTNGSHHDEAEMLDSKEADSDFDVIDENDEVEEQPQAKKRRVEEDEQLRQFDVQYGVAHGYWKDLLNILALAANDELKVDGSPRSVLNVEKPAKLDNQTWTLGRKKQQTAERHERLIKKLESDSFYKALHITVARIFADQLKTDYARLESDNKADLKRITLAAKWAPSPKGMHDQHTCIVSSIAELLSPFDIVCPDADPADRTLYLKHARESYQLEFLSRLRRNLQIVEHPISAKKFEEIKYDRVPSLAMKRYTPLFVKKDYERFDKYIEGVAQGKARISGATLLPSTLVKNVSGHSNNYSTAATSKAKSANALVGNKMAELSEKTADGQWNALVQRIKNNGTLENSIAVCDVSSSMLRPAFPDHTCPMHSAIGLSLLLAEITKPPFGGAFITFSATPQVMRVGGPDDKRKLKEKVAYIQASYWDMNTDFVAVFERLILPMAIENNLSQEDMVKQVFVFSDMQFDAAGKSGEWSTSYERIKEKFKDAGYRMPKLIFWNLAGGRTGYSSHDQGDNTAPKPVTAADEGTALVSGYSQGQLKMFLDNGQFEDPHEEELVEEMEDENGDVVVQRTVKKSKQDPLAMVKKAISHEAYGMLKVVD